VVPVIQVKNQFSIRSIISSNETPCSLVQFRRYFVGMYCLHLRGRIISQATSKKYAYDTPKRRWTTGLHCLTSPVYSHRCGKLKSNRVSYRFQISWSMAPAMTFKVQSRKWSGKSEENHRGFS
jgi:hypothetical protein